MSDRVLTDYEKFVNTEALLACQRPIDGLVNTHELFFQVTHQVMELWMKVIAHELRVVMDEMAHDDLLEAASRLQRGREIARLLTAAPRTCRPTQPYAIEPSALHSLCYSRRPPG